VRGDVSGVFGVLGGGYLDVADAGIALVVPWIKSVSVGPEELQDGELVFEDGLYIPEEGAVEPASPAQIVEVTVEREGFGHESDFAIAEVVANSFAVLDAGAALHVVKKPVHHASVGFAQDAFDEEFWMLQVEVEADGVDEVEWRSGTFLVWMDFEDGESGRDDVPIAVEVRVILRLLPRKVRELGRGDGGFVAGSHWSGEALVMSLIPQ
jgi:hypothetical protein